MASSVPRAVRVWRRLVPLLPALPIGAAGWFVHVFNPTDVRHQVTGPCTWHVLTGINGPTCGGTRAFYYLVHGDLVESLRFYAPLATAAPLLGYWWLASTLEIWFGLRLPRLRPRRWMVISYIVAALIFTTVLRNLPVAGLRWFDIPGSSRVAL